MSNSALAAAHLDGERSQACQPSSRTLTSADPQGSIRLGRTTSPSQSLLSADLRHVSGEHGFFELCSQGEAGVISLVIFHFLPFH